MSEKDPDKQELGYRIVGFAAFVASFLFLLTLLLGGDGR